MVTEVFNGRKDHREEEYMVLTKYITMVLKVEAVFYVRVDDGQFLHY